MEVQMQAQFNKINTNKQINKQTDKINEHQTRTRQHKARPNTDNQPSTHVLYTLTQTHQHSNSNQTKFRAQENQSNRLEVISTHSQYQNKIKQNQTPTHNTTQHNQITSTNIVDIKQNQNHQIRSETNKGKSIAINH